MSSIHCVQKPGSPNKCTSKIEHTSKCIGMDSECTLLQNSTIWKSEPKSAKNAFLNQKLNQFEMLNKKFKHPRHSRYLFRLLRSGRKERFVGTGAAGSLQVLTVISSRVSRLGSEPAVWSDFEASAGGIGDELFGPIELDLELTAGHVHLLGLGGAKVVLAGREDSHREIPTVALVLQGLEAASEILGQRGLLRGRLLGGGLRLGAHGKESGLTDAIP